MDFNSFFLLIMVGSNRINAHGPTHPFIMQIKTHFASFSDAFVARLPLAK